MSEILKTKGIVLKKIEYNESSKIARIFSDEYGKISVVVKGARSQKSQMGKIVDSLNLIDFVYYNKSTRDLQILTQANLINHYQKIREDYSSIIYATSILELLEKLLPEEEIYHRLFNGTVRIFELINERTDLSGMLFLKYFHFILNEIGYNLNIESCVSCQSNLLESTKIGFSISKGFICENCLEKEIITNLCNLEHFKNLHCTISKNYECQLTEKEIQKFVELFENYLIHHVENFSGLKSLKLLRI